MLPKALASDGEGGIGYAAVVKLVHVVPPSVFTYIRVEADEPAVFMNREPFAALIPVGALSPTMKPIPAVRNGGSESARSKAIVIVLINNH